LLHSTIAPAEEAANNNNNAKKPKTPVTPDQGAIPPTFFERVGEGLLLLEEKDDQDDQDEQEEDDYRSAEDEYDDSDEDDEDEEETEEEKKEEDPEEEDEEFSKTIGHAMSQVINEKMQKVRISTPRSNNKKKPKPKPLKELSVQNHSFGYRWKDVHRNDLFTFEMQIATGVNKEKVKVILDHVQDKSKPKLKINYELPKPFYNQTYYVDSCEIRSIGGQGAGVHSSCARASARLDLINRLRRNHPVEGGKGGILCTQEIDLPFACEDFSVVDYPNATDCITGIMFKEAPLTIGGQLQGFMISLVVNLVAIGWEPPVKKRYMQTKILRNFDLDAQSDDDEVIAGYNNQQDGDANGTANGNVDDDLSLDGEN
jgi:hypothetical protein